MNPFRVLRRCPDSTSNTHRTGCIFLNPVPVSDTANPLFHFPQWCMRNTLSVGDRSAYRFVILYPNFTLFFEKDSTHLVIWKLPVPPERSLRLLRAHSPELSRGPNRWPPFGSILEKPLESWYSQSAWMGSRGCACERSMWHQRWPP